MADMAMHINITDKAFNPEAQQAEFRARLTQNNGCEVGAITAFTGLVRGHNLDDEIQSLTLSHYPDFTQKAIAQMGTKAMRRWPIVDWQVTHRIGVMRPGEAIVFVATASAHRRASFEAADFLMDYLKSEAPLWKQEQSGDRNSWIEPRQADIKDKARWSL